MTETAVLVGGLGFIGRHLSRELSARGWRVVATTRRSPREKVRGVEVVARVREPGDMPESVSPDIVYYLPGRPGGRESALRLVHVSLAGEWAMYAALHGARYVYASSIAVTADFSQSTGPSGRIVEEEPHLSGRSPAEGDSTHSRTKAEMERLLVSGEPGRALRGRFTIVRPGLVYSTRGGHLEWRLLSLLARLRVRPESGVLPLVSARCLARLLAGPVAEGRLDGAWVNVVEPRSLGRVLDLLYGPCRGACLRFRVDGLARALARAAPSWSKARLAYAILSRSRPYGSRHIGDPCRY